MRSNSKKIIVLLARPLHFFWNFDSFMTMYRKRFNAQKPSISLFIFDPISHKSHQFEISSSLDELKHLVARNFEPLYIFPIRHYVCELVHNGYINQESVVKFRYLPRNTTSFLRLFISELVRMTCLRLPKFWWLIKFPLPSRFLLKVQFIGHLNGIVSSDLFPLI